ncbi:MAG: RNA polymerase subunit sigma-70 [Actinobacteria bacterium RBG_16_64_13]|nr:MAG: RNA polymerase subunit sigma-70 [Actinobacteria bacterium RBG_16_64_13]
MSQWNELTDLTGDRPFVVTAVRLESSGLTISGEFELPPLAGLRYEDQVFVSEFVRCHGSIKYMEKAFGISYPTVKNRLNKIVQQLQLVEVVQVSGHDEVFDLLERGEISVAEAAERLEK